MIQLNHQDIRSRRAQRKISVFDLILTALDQENRTQMTRIWRIFADISIESILIQFYWSNRFVLYETPQERHIKTSGQ